jgi:hypothetical protein
MPDEQERDEEDTTFELSNMDIDTVGLVGAAANGRSYLLFKNEQGEGHMGDQDNATPLEDVAAELDQAEDVTALKSAFQRGFEALVGLFQSSTEPEADVEKGDPDPAPDPEPDPIIEKFEKMLEDQNARLEKAQARAEEAEQIAKEERDRRIQAEYVAKAESLALPGEVKDLAKLLKAADEMDEDVGELLQGVLKSASEAVVQSGVFAERGDTRVEKSDEPFLVEVQKRADALRENDPELTEEIAFAKAYKALGKEKPDLARAYTERQREVRR